MKILEISIEDKDLPKMKNILDEIGFIKSIKEKPSFPIDEITLVSEVSLAEEWNSEEDSRYDRLFKK